MEERLRAAGRAAGLDAIGFTTADPFVDTREVLEDRKAKGLAGTMQFTYRNPARSTEPERILEGAASLVVAARSYHHQRPESAHSSPGEIAAYAWRDHYSDLRAGLEAMAEVLRAEGYQARVVADDNALVDRAAAHRAGLGWFGKNANLLLPGKGSWFVLGSVITDATLAPNPSPEPDGCGPCRRCLDSCPTEAIVAPGVVDATRCLAWLVQAPGDIPLEFRTALGARIYGCDDCQTVCPPNRRQDPAEVAGDAVADIDLVELLALDDDELLARHGRWYIPERNPDYLRRNALIGLGNTGSLADPMVHETLTRYCENPSSMLREHASWALQAAQP